MGESKFCPNDGAKGKVRGSLKLIQFVKALMKNRCHKNCRLSDGAAKDKANEANL